MSENSRQTLWYRQVAADMSRHILMKGIGTTLFISSFFAAYFYLLEGAVYPVAVMPIIFLDRLVGFQPMALLLYVSLWFYVSLPPALLATRRELYGYGLAMAGTCLAGLLVFYFWPTVVPVADIDWSQYPEVDFLKSIDAAGNACPSLHVATAVFSAVWLHHLLRRFGVPLWLIILNWMWCVGIVYSTMATRQHVAVDVFAGLGLGVPAAYLSLRYRIDAERVNEIRDPSA